MKNRNIVEALIYNNKREILMQKKTIDYPVFLEGDSVFLEERLKKMRK